MKRPELIFDVAERDAPWMPDDLMGQVFGSGNQPVGLTIDRKCVAVGDFRRIHSGCAEVYVVFNGRPAPGVVVATRSVFQQLADTYHRVQAMVNLDNAPAIRYCRWIGMRPEAIIAESGPKRETYILFASIKGVDR